MSATPTSSAPSRRPDLLRPEVLFSLGGLELRTRRVVEGFLLGLHRSPHRGFSAEFAELRGYRPGDDLRHIDWRMFGRSDRFYVKQFEAETNLRGYLFVDGSASMEWSSAPGVLPTKRWYGVTLAAALSLLLLRQGDQVGLSVFDEEVRDWLPPRGGDRQWGEILRRLEAIQGEGKTDPGTALRETAQQVRRRGLIMVISDLLMEPQALLNPLRHLRHRGHDIMVFHLLDPGERELPGAGEVRLEDPESGAHLQVHAAEFKVRYRDAVDHAILAWRRELEGVGMGYRVVDTSRPLAIALRALSGRHIRRG